MTNEIKTKSEREINGIKIKGENKIKNKKEINDKKLEIKQRHLQNCG